MTKMSYEDIIRIHDVMIRDFFNYPEEYDFHTMTFLYAETKRRNLDISASKLSKLNLYAKKNGIDDIDTALKTLLEKNNYTSYEDYYKEKEEDIKKRQIESIENVNEETHNTKPILRYPALRTIAAMIKFFAIIIGIVTVIIVLLLLSQGSDYSLVFSLMALTIGVLMVIGLLATSETIKVLIDIEFNTRQTSKN